MNNQGIKYGKKQMILLSVIIIAVIVSFVSFLKPDPIVGKWEMEDVIYIFNKDGSGSYDGDVFTYTAEKGVLRISEPNRSEDMIMQYEIDGDVMTLTSSETETLHAYLYRIKD